MEQNTKVISSDTISSLTQKWVDAHIDDSIAKISAIDGCAGLIWVNHTLREYICIPSRLADRSSLVRISNFLYGTAKRRAWWLPTDNQETVQSFVSTSAFLDYSPCALLSGYQSMASNNPVTKQPKQRPTPKKVVYSVLLVRDAPKEMEYADGDPLVPFLIPLKDGLCLWRQCEDESE
jgi:hypothetical protein